MGTRWGTHHSRIVSGDVEGDVARRVAGDEVVEHGPVCRYVEGFRWSVDWTVRSRIR